MEGDMRKLILISAMVLVSATAHAGGQRGLTLASSDEPAKSVEAKPADTTAAETSKYVERPSTPMRRSRRLNASLVRRPLKLPRQLQRISPPPASRGAGISRRNPASSPNCIVTASIGSRD
jgi:hypothetical protein